MYISLNIKKNYENILIQIDSISGAIFLQYFYNKICDYLGNSIFIK